MKKFGFSLLSILCTSYSAMAIYNPNWERPLFEAQMTEIDHTRHEVGQGLEKLLTLHQRDGEQAPTTISFREETYNICLMLYLPGQNCPMTRKDTRVFKIQSIKTNGCRAVTYEAREVVKALDAHAPAMIQLVDHSNDICEYVVSAIWEAKLSVPSQKDRYLKGNPTGVATIE